MWAGLVVRVQNGVLLQLCVLACLILTTLAHVLPAASISPPPWHGCMHVLLVKYLQHQLVPHPQLTPTSSSADHFSPALPLLISTRASPLLPPRRPLPVYDALRRKFQCATVQLDFQLPIRFNLEYATESGLERPVIVHRAVLGSVERMFAILTEHYAGKWPLWLSPRQVMVVPISENSYGYSQEVRGSWVVCPWSLGHYVLGTVWL
jgi:hypothetical protein